MKKTVMLLGVLALLLALVPAAPAAAQPGMGFARLNVTLAGNSTVDWANLVIDGKGYGRINRGETKLVTLGFGKRVDVIVERDGVRAVQGVQAFGGRVTPVTLTLITIQYGTLTIVHRGDSGEAWADYAVNGANKGRLNRGQSATLRLEAKRQYHVVLMGGGRQEARTVMLGPNMNTTVDLGFRAMHGSIHVRMLGAPGFDTATVLLDGAPRAGIRHGQMIVLANVPAGPHTVALKCDGAHASQTVVVNAGRPTDVVLRLVAAPVARTMVAYSAHVRDIGWMAMVHNGATAGTTGQSRRMEAVRINVSGIPGASVRYRAHVANIGWMGFVANGAVAGTTGQSRQMEAVEIRLENARGYSIEYRVHVQDIGWMGWVRDGQQAGTTGQSKRMEAIEIRIVRK